MASGQEAGTVEIYVKKVSGNRFRLLVNDVGLLAPAGGAADGALASVKTPDQLLHIPIKSSIPIENDDIIEVHFTAIGADGIDVSDSLWRIPMTLADGSVKHLVQGDFANPAPVDYTTVADIPVIVGGHKVVDGKQFFGGGVIFLDMQDDTA